MRKSNTAPAEFQPISASVFGLYENYTTKLHTQKMNTFYEQQYRTSDK